MLIRTIAEAALGIFSMGCLCIGVWIDISFIKLFKKKNWVLVDKNVPWDFKDLFQLSILFISVNLGIVYTDYLLEKIGLHFTIISQSVFVAASTVIAHIVVALAVLWKLKMQYRTGLIQIGLRNKGWVQDLFKGFYLYLGFIPILLLMSRLTYLVSYLMNLELVVQPIVDLLTKEKTMLGMGSLVVFIVFMAPVFEEVMFRGFFYPVAKRHFGGIGGALLTSMLFAALHFNLAAFLPIFALGLVLVVVYEKSGSLLVPIGLHVTNNILAIVFTLIIQKQPL
ncbi:MAG: type II CAAX endopeptidase family protein [Candidatus Theseobacter exili]|nr:type II CAAX endopeptidase family protein [Candidatus Theseobacter exili]